jgi:small-conductance mechanosensitive channel
LRQRKTGQSDSNSGSSHDELAPSNKHLSSSHELSQSSSQFFNNFQKTISKIVLADKPSASNRLAKNKMDINSDDYAKKVSRKLFYSLAYPEGIPYGQDHEDSKKHLDISAFTPYFKTSEGAQEAFQIFDKDGNGNLSRREFRDTVVQIYRDRKGLAQSMRDTSQALGKIDNTLLVIQLMITMIICLVIFNVNFWNALVPFGTLLVASTFIFDTSARNLCQGIVFQFVTHPYDSGDMVQIDGSYMLVENIGILGTVFETAEGIKMYAPTTVLITKLIRNIRRSGNMGEVVYLNVDFRTSNEQILELRERLIEWVNGQSRDFESGFDLRLNEIVDMNKVILSMWLPHKGNWVELSKRWQRKTRFMLALKTILNEMNIKYELPAQRISSDRSSLDVQNVMQQTTQKFNGQA